MFDLIPFGASERSLFNHFDNLERAFFGNAFPTASQFRTDILDEGDKYVLKAELPGFSKEDIQVDVDDNRLTVSATHKEEQKEEKDNYVRRERRLGAFKRSFDVTGIDTHSISASYTDGILNLSLPKVQPEPLPPARQIEIQ